MSTGPYFLQDQGRGDGEGEGEGGGGHQPPMPAPLPLYPPLLIFSGFYKEGNLSSLKGFIQYSPFKQVL